MYNQAKDPSTAPASDRGQIAVHLDRVCNLVEESLKLQLEIRERLSPISRPEPPATGGNGPRPSEVLVPIADVLSRNADTLGELVSMQRDLLHRIEL